MRWAAAGGVAVAALAIWVALGQLSYEFFAIYGADPQAGRWDTAMLLNAMPFVLLVTLIVTGAVFAAFALAGQTRPRFLPIAGLSLVLTAGIAVGGAWLGTAAKQRGLQQAATACSTDERQALQAFGTVPGDGGYGTGMADGTCQGIIAFLADSQADTRLAAVRDTLTAQGWVATATPGEPRTTYTKGGKSLQVTVIRDKAVEVTLSFV
ncbi:hypothetical protein Rhe02_85990 [Rhizocola hellebori]|uniref:Uncharacterized protein n=2 Tax=Rhizocola hellebori TaxID=1392758 RepID=A0A8J3QI97_9ACTN|nr:hypothetical protein Rhe02_85990 [Rhizocola hellebori]